MTPRRSRLAPSPTGAMHLGNARSFLINWAMARSSGWHLVLRIEDLDHPRVRPDAIDELRRDLEWLGLDWDEEMPRQSTDLEPCRQALELLASRGLVFPCPLTRKEIATAQAAPHGHEDGHRYPPDLRPDDARRPRTDLDLETNWRFLVDTDSEPVKDGIAGTHAYDLAATTGDFPVWTRRGVPAYQLAVVVDDARQGITDVVRGDDLLESAARQQLVYRALGHQAPRWWHLPLVRGADGRRLAKRHGDTRLSRFRDDGCTPERLVGLLAAWCGVLAEPAACSAREFAQGLDLAALPRSDIVLSAEDLEWLAS